MDAAQAILVVVGPVGAAAVAFGKILLDRHLRTLEHAFDRAEQRWAEVVTAMAAELREERAARERSQESILDAVESLRRGVDGKFDEAAKEREKAAAAVIARVEDRKISGLKRAIREQSRPDADDPPKDARRRRE